MFRTLIYPSSGACDCAVQLPHWFFEAASACNTDTTPTQPHQISNTQRTKNITTNVVIRQHSRKLLMMDILMSETCWAHKKWNKIASDIKLVFYSSTITIIHNPINIRIVYFSAQTREYVLEFKFVSFVLRFFLPWRIFIVVSHSLNSNQVLLFFTMSKEIINPNAAIYAVFQSENSNMALLLILWRQRWKTSSTTQMCLRHWRFVFESLKGEKFLSSNIFNMTAFVSVLVRVICKLLRQ